MQIEYSSKSLSEIVTDITLVFVIESDKKDKKKYIPFADFKKIDAELANSLTKAADLSGFCANRGEVFSYFPQNKANYKWIVVVGLGEQKEISIETLRRVMGGISTKFGKKVESLAFSVPARELNLDPYLSIHAMVEGIVLGSYSFTKYKSKNEEKKRLSKIHISDVGDVKKIQKSIDNANIFSDATILARDLVNEQSAIATPTFLADLAASIAKKDPKHIKCKIIDKREAEKIGMNAFLGIARAADTPPKFIFLEYFPDKIARKEKLALVGKGITFDSGGINVKTGGHMIDMKMDMSGAAIILAVFSVISRIKPDYPVIGLIAATPNLISGTSIVPGDVVKVMNGKTIEVLDTDAEGRVTLADSLSFAVRENCTKIIDFATLTGAVMVALGTDISGLFSNNEKLTLEIKKAANLAGEKVWEMPLEIDYKEMNKSEVADVANIPNSRYGGSITAALFLQEFVGDIPWAHLDIAGPAFLSKASDISQKGGTGYGVRTVLNLLKNA